MDKSEMAIAIRDLLQAADRHPNSRVGKLIRAVQEESTQKDIVMLLIEVAEHSEYATDFDISLRYYLDLFDQLGVGRDIVLNEAGLLLLNASKIYARRVDFVHELAERQLFTIADTDKQLAEAKAQQQSENDLSAAKPKRGRKRPLVAQSDPFEIELAPKKFRKIADDKRFMASKSPTKVKTPPQLPNEDSEQQAHPACWQHSRIVDFDNEDNVDTKRNYKLFTYHIEHRYNTLVPDINFRLHFCVKDYLDQEAEENDEADVTSSANPVQQWPGLTTGEHARKYLRLETEVFEQDFSRPARRRRRREEEASQSCAAENADASTLQLLGLELRNDMTNTALEQVQSDGAGNASATGMPAASSTANDSGLGGSLLDSSSEIVNSLSGDASSLDVSSGNATTTTGSASDSGLGESLLNATDSITTEADGTTTTLETIPALDTTPALDNTSEPNNSSLSASEGGVTNSPAGEETTSTSQEIRVHLPHLVDEGVFLSDLDEHDCRMLSPTVVATDVFPAVPNKKEITIIIDDEIKALLNLPDDEPETYAEPKSVPEVPIALNFMQIHEKFLRRRVLFKLGPEYELFKQARSLKRARCAEAKATPRRVKLTEWFALNNKDKSDGPLTPPPSPEHEGEDFLGFSDTEMDFEGFSDAEPFPALCGDANKPSRYSQDSGVSVGTPSSDSRALDVFAEASINLNDLVASSGPESMVKEEQSEMACADKQQPLEKPTEKDACAIAEEGNPIEDNTNVETPSLDEASHQEWRPLLDNHELQASLAEIDMNASKTKVQKWHEYLQPILTKSRERHHFDVFAIGTEIIDQFPAPSKQSPVKANKAMTTTFADVMESKDTSYVSRYFLSSLLLANQGNIAINVRNQSPDEPTAWSDIHFQLCSTKRHTVAIEDDIGAIHTSVPKQPAKLPPGRVKSKAPPPDTASPASAIKAKKQRLHETNNNNSMASPMSFSMPPHLTSTPQTASLASTSQRSGLNMMAARQAHTALVNVNLSGVTPLRPIEKMPSENDDGDSGFFSRDEMST